MLCEFAYGTLPYPKFFLGTSVHISITHLNGTWLRGLSENVLELKCKINVDGHGVFEYHTEAGLLDIIVCVCK